MMLVDAEIGHIDWTSYPCPCGRDWEHVATLLRTLLASGTRFDTPRIEAVRAAAAGLLPRDLRDPAF